MKQIKVALARFYNAKFIQLNERDEIVWKHDYEDLHVVARLSKTTSFTKWGPVKFYVGPDEKATSKKYPTPGPEKYPADLYTEIITYKMVDVTDQEYELIRSESLEARGQLLKQFDQFEEAMQKSIDYCAGMLGVRVNPELVSIPIFDVDQRYVFINERVYAVQGGFILQVRDDVEVIHSGDEAIQHSLDILKIKKKKVEKATESLFWMLRGWSSEDQAQRFIAFFTALEFIIPGHKPIESELFFGTRDKLISLIEGDENFKEIELDLFLFKYPPPVSLSTRFKTFATASKLYDWEADITDFIEYHLIRNALLHRADSSMARSTYVENKLLYRFELFVQKYVRFILYGTRKEIASNTRKRTVIRTAGNFLVKDNS